MMVRSHISEVICKAIASTIEVSLYCGPKRFEPHVEVIGTGAWIAARRRSPIHSSKSYVEEKPSRHGCTLISDPWPLLGFGLFAFFQCVKLGGLPIVFWGGHKNPWADHREFPLRMANTKSSKR